MINVYFFLTYVQIVQYMYKCSWIFHGKIFIEIYNIFQVIFSLVVFVLLRTIQMFFFFFCNSYNQNIPTILTAVPTTNTRNSWTNIYYNFFKIVMFISYNLFKLYIIANLLFTLEIFLKSYVLFDDEGGNLREKICRLVDDNFWVVFHLK